MSNYQEYLKQIEELTRKAEAARKEETAAVIADIRSKIKAFGLTAADLGLAERRVARPARGAAKPAKAASEKAPRKGRPGAGKGVKRKIKYRGPAGQNWSGVGRKPVWLVEALAAGRRLEEFKVE